MNEAKLIVTYGARLLTREWRRFVLPFLSLAITAVVVMLMLMLTSASSVLLAEKARELQGGDVIIESNTPLDALYAELSQEFAVTLIPFITEEIFLNPDYQLGDGLHLNQAGYDAVVNNYLLLPMTALLNTKKN